MNKKKVISLFLATALTCTVAGATLAWFTSAENVSNKIATAIYNNKGLRIWQRFDPLSNTKPGEVTEKLVQIRNEANFDQFIRVKLEKVFFKGRDENEKSLVMSEDDMKKASFNINDIEIRSKNVINSVQFTNLDFSNIEKVAKDLEGKWLDIGDGYIYYMGKVKSGGFTASVLESLKIKSEAGNQYMNCECNVKVSAISVQASNNGFLQSFIESDETMNENLKKLFEYYQDNRDGIDMGNAGIDDGGLTIPMK